MQREQLVRSLTEAASSIRHWADIWAKEVDDDWARCIRQAFGRTAARLEADALLVQADGVNDDEPESTERAG